MEKLVVFLFFFQAEDGIRDLIVTGVQTCALPISRIGLHGEAFEQYHRSVPILVPGLRRYPGGREGWSFRLMVANQEPLVLAGILLVPPLLRWKPPRPSPEGPRARRAAAGSHRPARGT